MLKQSTEITEALKTLDNLLDRAKKLPGNKVAIIIAGGAAVMLGFSGKRYTEDIDIVHTGQLMGMGRIVEEAGGFHVVSDSIIHLHPDYRQRLLKEGNYKNMDVCLLSPVDIAIAKTARGTGKDFYDLYSSDVSKDIDLNEFESLFKEAMSYWVGLESRFLSGMEIAKDIIRDKQILDKSGVVKEMSKSLETITKKGALRRSVEAQAIAYVLKFTPDSQDNPPYSETAKKHALFLLRYAGESLADTKAEVIMAEALRRHFNNTRAGRELPPANTQGKINAMTLLKLFKTTAKKTVFQLGENKVKTVSNGLTQAKLRSP